MRGPASLLATRGHGTVPHHNQSLHAHVRDIREWLCSVLGGLQSLFAHVRTGPPRARESKTDEERTRARACGFLGGSWFFAGLGGYKDLVTHVRA
jgi:hypothetical protein